VSLFKKSNKFYTPTYTPTLKKTIITPEQRIVEEEMVLQKAINSQNPELIAKALQNIENNSNLQVESKGKKINPLDFITFSGYKEKWQEPSWELLDVMGRQENVNAIKKVRKNQTIPFTQRQKDKFSIGYTINKKDNSKITKVEEKQIEQLYNFFDNCGFNEYSVLIGSKLVKKKRRAKFSDWMKTMVDNSYTYDHAPYEIVLNSLGEPIYFTTLDAKTIRQADSYFEEIYSGSREQKNGEYPKWIQIINDVEVSAFYEDEIDVVIRNPQENIYNYGYGRSELEDLIKVVTNLINAYKHNSRAFSEILADRIINIKGNTTTPRLNEFRQLVRATLMGTNNSHGNLITASEKGMEIIKLNENNKDMEYSQWIRILVSLLCSLYTIAPEEINFESVKSAAAPLNEKNNEKLLKYSKDLGLRPILKTLEDSLNNKITCKFFDSKYQLNFVGLDADSPEQYLQNQKLKLETTYTINEIRAEDNRPPIEGGDIILSQVFTGYLQGLQQSQQNDNQDQQNKEGEEQLKEQNIETEQQEKAYKAFNTENIYQNLIVNYLNKIEENNV